MRCERVASGECAYAHTLQVEPPTTNTDLQEH